MSQVCKKIVSLILVVALFGCLSMTAFAADDMWIEMMRDFPERYDYAPDDGYVLLIQSDLWAYGGSSRTYISNAGGTDGQFGPNTKNAVVHFQQANNLKDDGIVGANTWGAFAELASTSYASSAYTFKINDNSCMKVVIGAASTMTTWYFYHRGTGSGFGHAVTRYVD